MANSYYNSLSPDANLEIWKDKPNGYFTVEEWLEANPPIEEEVEVKTLEELILEKTDAIDETRDALEKGGLWYDGNQYATDTDSQVRLLTASQTASTALASGTSYSVEWTILDKSTVTLSAKDLIELVPTFAVQANALHEEATKLKTEVRELETIEQVLEYQIYFDVDLKALSDYYKASLTNE